MRGNVRIKPCGHSFYLHYTSPEGCRRRLSAGTSRRVAEVLKERFTGWLLEGKDPKRELARQRTTLADFFDYFMEAHGTKKARKTQVSYLNSWKNISRCRELAQAPLGSIRKSLIYAYEQARLKEGARGGTINRETSLIDAMMTLAVRKEILDVHPLRGRERLKENKRAVVLSVEQARMLIEALSSPIAEMAEFAIYSGFRKESILDLRIEDVRFHDLTDTGEARIIEKGGRRVVKPLGKLAVEILKRVIGDRTEGHVFLNACTGKRYVDIRKAFNIAVRKLGLEVGGTDLRFHDLRHVFATWLRDRGADLDSIQELMGHSDRATTEGYITRKVSGDMLNLMPRIREEEK